MDLTPTNWRKVRIVEAAANAYSVVMFHTLIKITNSDKKVIGIPGIETDEISSRMALTIGDKIENWLRANEGGATLTKTGKVKKPRKKQ